MNQSTGQPFFVRIFRMPPLLFPLALLFHLAILVYAALPYINQGGLFSYGGMVSWGWCLIYLLCWLFICDMRKWAATAYMIFTAINLLLQFGLAKYPLWHEAGASLFPVDALLTAFLLFYYKRFR